MLAGPVIQNREANCLFKGNTKISSDHKDGEEFETSGQNTNCETDGGQLSQNQIAEDLYDFINFSEESEDENDDSTPACDDKSEIS